MDPSSVRTLRLVAQDLGCSEVSAGEHPIWEMGQSEAVEQRRSRASPTAAVVPRCGGRDTDDPRPEAPFGRECHDEVVLVLGDEVGEKRGHVAAASLGQPEDIPGRPRVLGRQRWPLQPQQQAPFEAGPSEGVGAIPVAQPIRDLCIVLGQQADVRGLPDANLAGGPLQPEDAGQTAVGGIPVVSPVGQELVPEIALDHRAVEEVLDEGAAFAEQPFHDANGIVRVNLAHVGKEAQASIPLDVRPCQKRRPLDQSELRPGGGEPSRDQDVDPSRLRFAEVDRDPPAGHDPEPVVVGGKRPGSNGVGSMSRMSLKRPRT